MDSITIKTTNPDEYGPRYYHVSGSDFNTMKDAIKANGGKFETTPVKAWIVTPKTLEQLPFAITEESPFRVSPTEPRIIDGHSYYPHRDHSEFDLMLEWRDQYGTWRLIDHPYRIQFDTTDDTVAAKLAELTAANPGYNFFNRDSAVRRLALESKAAKAIEILAQIENIRMGRYTKEAIRETITFIKDMK